MLTSSSPTISAPSSPSAAFHTHSRSYHASRRTSTSSRAPSPRFQVSAPPRRFETPQIPTAAIPIPVPVPNFASSPRIKRKEYVDSGTQYSPLGFPPTYHPTSEPHPNSTAPSLPTQTAPTNIEQRETSAQPAVTEPSEPEVRIDPQPTVPAQTSQTPAKKSPAKEEGLRGGQKNAVSKSSNGNAKLQLQSSPTKRARSDGQNIKVMPLKYETCDVKDLGILISDMLMELVRLNDGFPLRDGQLTRFHSRAPPGISVRDYLFRLIVHATLSPPILLSMVFYVDKLCTMYPAFTISSLTVHRFLITAATVAAKGLSDSFWTNSLYAKVGGVSVRELALLELEFLRKLEWRIVPKPETLVDYYKGLVDRGDGYVLEKTPESSPSLSPSTPPKVGEIQPSGGSVTDLPTDQ